MVKNANAGKEPQGSGMYSGMNYNNTKPRGYNNSFKINEEYLNSYSTAMDPKGYKGIPPSLNQKTSKELLALNQKNKDLEL